jgi:hypothetical protein
MVRRKSRSGVKRLLENFIGDPALFAAGVNGAHGTHSSLGRSLISEGRKERDTAKYRVLHRNR